MCKFFLFLLTYVVSSHKGSRVIEIWVEQLVLDNPSALYWLGLTYLPNLLDIWRIFRIHSARLDLKNISFWCSKISFNKYKTPVRVIGCKCKIFVEYTLHFNSITAVINTKLVAMQSDNGLRGSVGKAMQKRSKGGEFACPLDTL